MIRRLIQLILVGVALYGGYLLYTQVLGPMINDKEAMGNNSLETEDEETPSDEMTIPE